jgi:hypothetical protein
MRSRRTSDTYRAARLALAGVVACTITAVGSPAEAADTPRVVLTPSDYAGDLDADVKQGFERRLLEGLGDEGIEIVSKLGSKGKACEDAECFKAVASDEAAQYVVTMSVSARDRVYQVAIELADGSNGERITRQSDLCDICSAEEVEARILAAASAVREILGSAMLGQPRLSVTSTPPGAQVFLDGEMIGTTPLDTTVEPGRHVVRIGGDGLVAQEREVLFVEGGREVYSAQLDEVGQFSGETEKDDTHRYRPLVISGAVLLGVGLGAAGGGIPLILIDGKENKNRCTDADRDINGKCPWSYETFIPGIALSAGGGALAIAGAALLGVGLKRRKEARERAKTQTSLQIGPTRLGVRVSF